MLLQLSEEEWKARQHLVMWSWHQCCIRGAVALRCLSWEDSRTSLRAQAATAEVRGASHSGPWPKVPRLGHRAASSAGHLGRRGSHGSERLTEIVMKWTRKVSPCLDHRSSGGPQLTRKSPSQRTCFLQDTQRARRLAEPSLWLQPSCGRWSASKAWAAWQSKRGQGLGPLCENSMRSSGTNTTVLLDFTTEMAGPTSAAHPSP